jgi:hypothetical protein
MPFFLGLSRLEHTPVPTEWQKVAEALVLKHRDRGWKDILIGLPNCDESRFRAVSLCATSPTGECYKCVVTLDQAGFESLDKILYSN